MYIVHCCRKFKNYKTWFLSDIEGFTERKLFLFMCPSCLKEFVVLSERKIDSKEVFTSKKKTGKEAEKIKEREIGRRLYSSDDVVKTKGKPFGFVYGENKEIHDKKGNVLFVRQSACDFYGQKEIVNCISD